MREDLAAQYRYENLISHIGLPWLQAHGYINIVKKTENGTENGGPAQAPTKVTKRLKKSLVAALKGKQKSQPEGIDQPKEPDPIVVALHPVVARECWGGISDEQWAALQDTLKLFTRIMDNQAILGFFFGLLQDNEFTWLSDKTLTWAFMQYGRSTQISFVAKKPATYGGHTRALNLMRVVMPKALSWHFDTELNADTTWAMTTVDVNKPGMPEPGKWTIGSTISIRADFIDVLTGRIKASDEELSWPGDNIDDESALIRTKFYLAINMIHEFAHAFWMSHNTNYRPWDRGREFERRYYEPYYGNDRINELGFALEVSLFSGNIQPLGPCHSALPYGLVILRWPPRSSYPKPNPYFADQNELGSALKFGHAWSTYYAIDMAFIQRLFTDRFWERDVQVFGMMRALRPRREIGIRCASGGLYPGESPGAREQEGPARTPDSDVSSAEDRFSPDLVIRGQYEEWRREEERRKAAVALQGGAAATAVAAEAQ